VTVVVDDDLRPWWESDGLADLPPVSDALPPLPDWLLEAPVWDEPVACECGQVSPPPPDREPEPQEPLRWAIPGVWDDEPEPFVLSVGDLVAQLQRVVTQLATVDPVTLSPGQALGESEALLHVQQRLRVQQLARTQDVSERRLFAEVGYRSTNTWLRTVAPDADSKDTTLAGRLGAMSHLNDALTGGRVCVTAARKVAAAVRKVRPYLDRPNGLIEDQPASEVIPAVVGNVIDLVCRDRFGLVADPKTAPEQAALLATLEAAVTAIVVGGGSQQGQVEQAMVLLAEHLRAGSLDAGLEELILAIVPSILEDREKTALDKRAFALSPNPDGTWQVSATLTAECGEQLHTTLAAEARRDPANPEDTAARQAQRAAQAEAAGTDPWTAALDMPDWERRALREQSNGLSPDAERLVPRSGSKRLHDAFQRLLQRYLSAGMGGVHGKVPVQAAVTISERTIGGAPGAPPARGASGRPLARSLIRRWWCEGAHVTTLLMSRGWKPLGVVHSARTITGTELKAATVQFDNRCAGDGCCPGTPDPLIPLVPHHVRRHALFGQTSLEENLLACPNLHADLHVGKRTIRLRDGRLINEDGWIEDE
jgi:hypothetical protein